MSVIRPATLDDVGRLRRIGQKFFNESNLCHLTFDETACEALLTDVIFSPDHMILVAEDSAGLLDGFIIFDVQRYYTVEAMAHVFQFYVVPGRRGKGIGKALARAAGQSAKDLGAAVFYAASTGGFEDPNNDARYRQLFLSAGAEELGVFVRWDLRKFAPTPDERGSEPMDV